ncbi:MAG: subclass B3 metallo-beta-lactamase [Acidobacteria bacterium]|nr:MAG: subclass B3 metallo-beta-lactamase [Acidobacteriota bacterium]
MFAQGNNDWDEPFPPYRIIGNVYYVGTKGLASFLITTPDGNILINSDFERNVPTIHESVEKLGFRFRDTQILLGSHAHNDHMEGDAMVKELTGALVMAMAEDVPALEKMRPGNKPHPIDRVLHDNDRVTLGGTTLVAHLTPGHTKGCTTWTVKVQDSGKTYDVVIVGSVNVNQGYILLGNKRYPQIADDFARTFKILQSLPVDAFLGAHGNYYGMEAKYARMKAGQPNPFIDPAGYHVYLSERQRAFEAEWEKQKATAK